MSDEPMTIDEALTILDKVAEELGGLRHFNPRVFADTIEDECDSLWEANQVIRAHVKAQAATIEQLRAALLPFAAVADTIDADPWTRGNADEDCLDELFIYDEDHPLTNGVFRQARAALRETGE